jgi:hypothetical protein
MTAPGERIVAQGVERLPDGVTRTYSRWSTGAWTYVDRRESRWRTPDGESGDAVIVGCGCGVPPTPVRMVARRRRLPAGFLVR